MNKEIVGIFFIPAGIISMCMAALWQMYVMMTETYTLNGLARGIVVYQFQPCRLSALPEFA